MPLNITGSATLSSLTLSSAGGDAGETLATLKLAISTSDTNAICAALGVDGEVYCRGIVFDLADAGSL